MKKCDKCDIEFENHSLYANHIRWKHKESVFSLEGKERHSSAVSISNLKRFGGYWCVDTIGCSKCSTNIEIKYKRNRKKEKYFCSRKCANSRTFSKETKNKMSKSSSESLKKLWAENEDYVSKQLGKNKIFSSKGEREVVEYFKNTYPQYNWKSGLMLRYKNETICRDLWCDELRFCFEYDGIWHFKDINGQLEKKQRKDKLLEEWCIENNYRLFRLDEDTYKNDKAQSLKLIETFLFDKNINNTIKKTY